MANKRIVIQIILKNVEYELNNYSNLIGNLYTFLLPSISLKNAKKILIEFGDKSNDLIIVGGKIEQEFYRIQKTFDFDKFECINSQEKKEYLCDETYDCLKALFMKLQLKCDFLFDTYKFIKEINYQLKMTICGSPKRNSSKTIIASVVAEHFLDYALIFVNFQFSKTSILKDIILFKTVPAYFIYSKLIWTCKWINDESFLLNDKLKEINIKIDINGDVSISYNPIDRDNEGIKEEINYLTQDVYFSL